MVVNIKWNQQHLQIYSQTENKLPLFQGKGVMTTYWLKGSTRHETVTTQSPPAHTLPVEESSDIFSSELQAVSGSSSPEQLLPQQHHQLFVHQSLSPPKHHRAGHNDDVTHEPVRRHTCHDRFATDAAT